jgi:tetratricopeptide (TPR) repeat protein
MVQKMSSTNFPQNSRYYNAVVWTLVGILAISLFPWTGDWNTDGPRLAILIALIFLMSPTLLGWLAIFVSMIDRDAKNRLVFQTNKMIFSSAISIDKILRLVPNHLYGGGYFHHMQMQANNFIRYAKPDEAKKVLRDLRSDVEKKLGDDSVALVDVLALSVSVFRESDNQSECEEAIAKLRELFEKYESKISPSMICSVLSESACYLAKIGKLKESAKLISKATETFEGIEDSKIRESCRDAYYINIALANCYNENLDQALSLINEHQAWTIKNRGATSVDVVFNYSNASWIMNEHSMFQESVIACENALQLSKTSKAVDDNTVLIINGNYADALAGVGRSAEAKKLMDTHFSKLIPLQENCSPELAATYRTIARIYSSIGDQNAAQTNSEKAVSMLVDAIGPDHPRSKRWKKELQSFRKSMS